MITANISTKIELSSEDLERRERESLGIIAKGRNLHSARTASLYVKRAQRKIGVNRTRMIQMLVSTIHSEQRNHTGI